MVNQTEKYSCCVIGHRKLESVLIVGMRDAFEDLIKNRNVTIFNFGNYGEFNDFCYNILITLKRRYPQIKLVFYSLNGEVAFTFKEAEQYIEKYKTNKKKFPYKCFDEIINLKKLTKHNLNLLV